VFVSIARFALVLFVFPQFLYYIVFHVQQLLLNRTVYDLCYRFNFACVKNLTDSQLNLVYENVNRKEKVIKKLKQLIPCNSPWKQFWRRQKVYGRKNLWVLSRK